MEIIILGILWLITIATSFYLFSKSRTEKNRLIVELHDLEKEKVRLDSQLKHAEENVQRDRDLFKAVQKEMESHFRGLAAQALEGSNKQFLELAKSSFQKHSQQSESLLSQKEQQAIESLVNPLKLELLKS